MSFSLDPYEKPIAVSEVWYRGYRKLQYKDPDTKELVDRIRLTLDINPFDEHSELITTRLGEHLKIYITKPDIGA